MTDMWIMKHFFLPSVQEKDENMKTVQGLLEEGLIQVANKEEELKVPVFSRSERDNQKYAASHTFPHLTDISMFSSDSAVCSLLGNHKL